jgi:hypothetical protein
MAKVVSPKHHNENHFVTPIESQSGDSQTSTNVTQGGNHDFITFNTYNKHIFFLPIRTLKPTQDSIGRRPSSKPPFRYCKWF